MKTIVKSALLAIVLFGAVSLSAQQPRQGRQQRTPEERAKAMTDTMTKYAGLSEEQSAKVNALYLDRFKQMSQNRQQGQQARPAQGQGQGQRGGFGQDPEFTKKLNEVLTPEQAGKWTKYQEKMRAERAAARSDR